MTTSEDNANNYYYYKEPSNLFKRLFLPPKTPSLILSPQTDSQQQWLVYINEPPLPSIDLLCKHEEKLAGIRFDPTLLVPSRLQWGLDMKIQNILLLLLLLKPNNNDDKLIDIPLPNNSEGIRYIRFNPNPPKPFVQQFVFTSKIKG